MKWPDPRILDLLSIDLPIIQAPMAGPNTSALAIAVSQAGGLGSLPCALLTTAQVEREWASIRAATDRPVNLNFFCHRMPVPDAERERHWQARLAPLRDGTRPRPTSALSAFQSQPVRRSGLHADRTVATRSREFSLRTAAGRLAGTGASHRCQGLVECDHHSGGALAGSARLRRDHRAGTRSGRASRHVSVGRPRHAAGHARTGAAGGRLRACAGDRGRRHHGCARNCCGVCARRRCGAAGHRVSVLPGSEGSAPCMRLRCTRPPLARTRRRPG